MKNQLDNKPNLQKYLFIRGFLITNTDITNLDAFPFYGNWLKVKHGEYYFLSHKYAKMHFYEDFKGRTFFLMGHAYNPFTMMFNEVEVLKKIADSYESRDYIDCLNEITGVYLTGVIDERRIEFHVDASGMQSACYSVIDEKLFISSHPQLIGDICELKMDPFVSELVNYKWYSRVMGPYLPGDLTPFSEVKRVVPSIMYKYDKLLSHERFWFNKMFEVCDDYEKIITQASEILKNNMFLITKKWEKPWISLTGGIDSNTAFAAASGYYDKYETFSYLSAEKEVPDVEAAKKISSAFNVTHNIFCIPNESSEIEDYDLKVNIQTHNSGYIAKRKENESRKRIYLEQNCNCDVEVKSWSSETIRAYWYKHYGRKNMPKLSPKLYRNLYKIFISNRKLAHKIDEIFSEYIKKYEYESIPSCYPAADIHFNEVTWGSWGSTNISEMKYCFDLTIPYNNRYLLDLLFRVPLEKRISDVHHLDMKRMLNPNLAAMNIRVVNKEETRFRAFALNVIFTINSFLPF